MTEEKDRALCQKYPKIFRDQSGNSFEVPVHFGFEHGDGWYDIIDAACLTIQNHVDWKRRTEPFAKMSSDDFDQLHQPYAVQVKEKWGGLRFYVDNCDEHTRGVLSMAESMSFRICEVCGSPGKKRSGGWIKTLCDIHASEVR